MVLRVDPWDPEYGASIEFDPELEPAAGLDLTVEEPGAWSPLPAPRVQEGRCCAFVDGVRRIEVRLFAEEGDVAAPALAGSWAVGCAWSSRPPSIADVTLGRELVVGGGLPPTPLTRRSAAAVTFTASSVTGADPLDPLRGLQNADARGRGRARPQGARIGRKRSWSWPMARSATPCPAASSG